MRGCAGEWGRGDEDLISPEDGEASGPGGCVEAGLADDGFEDGEWFGGAVGEGMADG